MSSDTNNKSPNVIQAYLSYLQEMSGKISLRSGMENVLYKKTKKKHHYYLPASNSVDLLYLKQVKDHIDKEPDRQLFLGNGLVTGVIKKKKNTKYIVSPLLYFLVSIDIDDRGQLIHEVEWDSVSFNYDLLTLVLEKDSDEENEPEDKNYSKQLTNQFNNAEVFESIENDLEKCLNKEELIENLNKISTSREVFTKIKIEVEEFKQGVISEKDFDIAQLNELMKNEGLVFFNHLFFYVGSLPGQLSTYTALRKLIQEVK